MKMKNNSSKIGLLFIILLLALAGISISYAGLSDNIMLFGSVTTADDFTIFNGTNESAWARMYDDPENFTYSFPGNNWATYILCTPTEDLQTFYLYADQHYRVGELHVWKNEKYHYIQYDLDEGFLIEETHLHIASSLNTIPQTFAGNPIPGLFSYNRVKVSLVQTQDTYQIQWTSEHTPLYIAAHCVVYGQFQ